MPDKILRVNNLNPKRKTLLEQLGSGVRYVTDKVDNWWNSLGDNSQVVNMPANWARSNDEVYIPTSKTLNKTDMSTPIPVTQGDLRKQALNVLAASAMGRQYSVPSAMAFGYGTAVPAINKAINGNENTEAGLAVLPWLLNKRLNPSKARPMLEAKIKASSNYKNYKSTQSAYWDSKDELNTIGKRLNDIRSDEDFYNDIYNRRVANREAAYNNLKGKDRSNTAIGEYSKAKAAERKAKTEYDNAIAERTLIENDYNNKRQTVNNNKSAYDKANTETMTSATDYLNNIRKLYKKGYNTKKYYKDYKNKYSGLEGYPKLKYFEKHPNVKRAVTATTIGLGAGYPLAFWAYNSLYGDNGYTKYNQNAILNTKPYYKK